MLHGGDSGLLELSGTMEHECLHFQEHEIHQNIQESPNKGGKVNIMKEAKLPSMAREAIYGKATMRIR